MPKFAQKRQYRYFKPYDALCMVCTTQNSQDDKESVYVRIVSTSATVAVASQLSLTQNTLIELISDLP